MRKSGAGQEAQQLPAHGGLWRAAATRCHAHARPRSPRTITRPQAGESGASTHLRRSPAPGCPQAAPPRAPLMHPRPRGPCRGCGEAAERARVSGWVGGRLEQHCRPSPRTLVVPHCPAARLQPAVRILEARRPARRTHCPPEPLAGTSKLPFSAQAELQLVQLRARAIPLPLALHQRRLQLLQSEIRGQGGSLHLAQHDRRQPRRVAGACAAGTPMAACKRSQACSACTAGTHTAAGKRSQARRARMRSRPRHPPGCAPPAAARRRRRAAPRAPPPAPPPVPPAPSAAPPKTSCPACT